MEEYLKRLRVLAGINESAIKEAPITDFGTVGDFDKPASISYKSDRRSVTDERMIKQIKQKWENTPFNFNLYFVNKPGYEKYLVKGPVDIKFIQQNFPELENSISDDSINVIYTSNEGRNRIRLTPWIIAHRLSHVVNYGSRGDVIFNSDVADFIIRIYENHFHMMLYELDIPGLDYLPDVKTYLSRNPRIPIYFYEYIGTMNSSRKGILTNELEFIHEVFAQYLLQGRITFNPLNQSFFNKLILMLNDYVHIKLKTTDIDLNSPAIKKFNKTINNIAKQLPELFANGLKTYIGEILVV